MSEPTAVMKTVPTTCACGHKGRSKQPEYYRCGYCYYMYFADGTEAQLVKLKARIAKLEGEVLRFRGKALAFKGRHADVGTVEDRWA